MASERGQTLYLKGTWGTQRQGGLVCLMILWLLRTCTHCINGLLLQAIQDYRALSQDTKEREGVKGGLLTLKEFLRTAYNCL